MTADLDAIRARLAAATPGEWVAHEFHERGSGRVFMRSVETFTADVIGPDSVDCTSYCYGGASRYTLGAADADLIANAPADLAELCDEVESLRAAVQRVRALVEDWSSHFGSGSHIESVMGRQVVSVDFATETILRALDGAE